MPTDAMEVPTPTMFFDDRLITNVLYDLKSGKEATVFCCEGGPTAGARLVAAKVFHPGNVRSFQNDSLYRQGRVITDARLRRAARKKTRIGRRAEHTSWVGHEYATLRLLHAAGADVPRPVSFAAGAILSAGFQQSGYAPGAILMEYIGDDKVSAPLLKSVSIDPADAQDYFDLVIRNVELFLSCNIVHADLSAFNILYWDGDLTIIDFPQAVDPRTNPHAYSLLQRDVNNVYRYFTRYGVQADAYRIASGLWDRFLNTEL